jgi:uncharacterized protein
MDDSCLLATIEPSHYVAVECHSERSEGSASRSRRIGLPTIQDILAELARPGRDPRDSFEPFHFAPHVRTLADLAPGMTLPGIVTNVTQFGAFVDVGLHDPGLIPTRFLDGHSLHIHQRIHVTVQESVLEESRLLLALAPLPTSSASPDGRL